MKLGGGGGGYSPAHALIVASSVRQIRHRPLQGRAGQARNGRSAILSPTQSYADTAIQEPNVLYDNGLWRMWYTASWDTPALALATYPGSSDPTVVAKLISRVSMSFSKEERGYRDPLLPPQRSHLEYSPPPAGSGDRRNRVASPFDLMSGVATAA